MARGETVRATVRHAAVECFGAFGFEGTSTRAVAERAEVSHSLLLYHFNSKDELWRVTMEEVLEHYLEGMQRHMARASCDDPSGKLRLFIDHFVRYSARVPQLQRIMVQQSTQGSDRIEWLVQHYLRDSFDHICTLVAAAQGRQEVMQGEPGRVYYAAIGLAGTLLSLSSEYQLLTGRDVLSESEIRKTIDFINSVIFRPA